MNVKRIILVALRVIGSNVRLFCGKLIHGSRLKYDPLLCIAYSDSISLSASSTLFIGKRLRTRGNCSLNVSESGRLMIGRNVFFNRGCLVNCHYSILIGDGCEFGPNVLIYDHDLDFRSKGGIKDGSFRCKEVFLGENCWIGAGAIILRGTHVGANSVIAAGSIVKGFYPENSLIVQKRCTEVSSISRRVSD
ncbi:acyltransferase [Adlercreutzia sp. ZJ242]|uniref:acyltransferase n=1 Tax=Adlercreutzia sp. ZJ242 TaxID=2709409 RepID=UPI0013EB4A13|nr:acyltransferase [Adlercreutzia sp. ZJ242]